MAISIPVGKGQAMRWRAPVLAALGLLIGGLTLTGCTSRDPVVVSREALGTVVSVTAYGADEEAVRLAIERSFATMAEVESALDAYDASSAISAFNARPYTEQPLPADAVTILDAIDSLGVSAEFSPALLSVSRLYGFDGAQTVPASEDLLAAVSAAHGFHRIGHDRAAFTGERETGSAAALPGARLTPGLDFGGAAKGLALDRARETLRSSGAVTAALVSAGSTTVTLGTKPDGSVWRIGVEDPREPGTVVAVFQFESDGALSTSGDYQQAFEVDGVLYHHILDPATGQPARGVRSLTVAGAGLSALDSDILSTALFVKNRGDAAAYAHRSDLALYIVDDEGRALVVPAPAGSGLVVAEEAPPKP